MGERSKTKTHYIVIISLLIAHTHKKKKELLKPHAKREISAHRFLQDNRRYSNYVKSPMCRNSVPRKQNAQKGLYLWISRDLFQKKQIALEEQEFLQSRITAMYCCSNLSAMD